MFFELENGFEVWALNPSSNVLLFDPTHSTNAYDMKLCLFVTVHPHGYSTILAATLLKSETSDSFLWALACFHKTFKVPPRVFFSDSDAGIENAFNTLSSDTWQGTLHFYCIFHISKNFYQHISPMFVGDIKKFKHVHDWFWRLAKETDTEAQGDFNCEWEDLTSYVISETTCTNDSKLDRVVEWLDNLLRRAPQWAYRYTWQHCTWGVHSTQRSEAMNSAVKGFLDACTLLVELLNKLEQYNSLRREGKEANSIRLSFRQAEKTAMLPAFITSLQGKITPYAYDLLVSQAVQALKYDAEKQDNGTFHVRISEQNADSGMRYHSDGSPASYTCPIDRCQHEGGSVRIVNSSAEQCSCQLEKALGVPCRHEIKVMIIEQCKEISLQRIGGKWHVVDTTTVNTRISRLRVLLVRPHHTAQKRRPRRVCS